MEKLFNIVRKGYDQDEVDSYIQSLEAVIKSYKDKDDTIKNAIINAQISADNIIKNSEIEADRISKRAVRLVNEIHVSISSQKQIVHSFQEEYNRLVSKYLQNIGSSEVEKVLGKIAELEQYLGSIQKLHEVSRSDTAGVPRDLPRMVAGSRHMQDTHDRQSVADDDTDEDTVALVAELLAKDKPNS